MFEVGRYSDAGEGLSVIDQTGDQLIEKERLRRRRVKNERQ